MSKVTANGIKKFLKQTNTPMIEELYDIALQIKNERSFDVFLVMLNNHADELNYDDDYHWYNIGLVAMFGLDVFDDEEDKEYFKCLVEEE